jgi:GNAT superfamily N-acetyltransferase
VIPGASSCSIRRATSADASGILECLRDAFEPYRERYTAEAFEDTVLTTETVQERLASMSIFVAVTAEGKIVGTISCSRTSEDEGRHLRGMAVLEEWRGQGVAWQLLDAAESELRARGCHRITLDTTEPLTRAIRFYEKNGYRWSGKVTDFFGMPLFEYVKPV